MKTSILDKPRRVAGACVLILAGAALTACGGGGGGNSSTPPGDQTPPPPTIDSFFAYVEARVGTLLDGDEPIDITAVEATTQDTTEPEPLK